MSLALQSGDLRPYGRLTSRANIVAVTTMDTGRMLIESAMPTYDVVITEHLVVAADPPATFTAARELDLLTVRTPLLTLSMWLRGLPARWSGTVTSPPPSLVIGEEGLARGHHWPAAQPRDRLRRGGKVLAAHHRMAPVSPEDFSGFAESGWGKIAANISVLPYGESASLLTSNAAQ